jgi:hypothetical protein
VSEGATYSIIPTENEIIWHSYWELLVTERNGDTRWSDALESGGEGTVVSDGLVYTATSDDISPTTVYDITDGTEVNSHPEATSTPVVNGNVFLPTPNTIYELDGDVVAQYDVSAPDPSLYVVDGEVYVQADDGVRDLQDNLVSTFDGEATIFNRTGYRPGSGGEEAVDILTGKVKETYDEEFEREALQNDHIYYRPRNDLSSVRRVFVGNPILYDEESLITNRINGTKSGSEVTGYR